MEKKFEMLQFHLRSRLQPVQTLLWLTYQACLKMQVKVKTKMPHKKLKKWLESTARTIIR